MGKKGAVTYPVGVMTDGVIYRSRYDTKETVVYTIDDFFSKEIQSEFFSNDYDFMVSLLEERNHRLVKVNGFEFSFSRDGSMLVTEDLLQAAEVRHGSELVKAIRIASEVQIGLSKYNDIASYCDLNTTRGFIDARKGFVYLIKSDTGFHKIGYAADLEKRLYRIAWDAPFEVKLINSIYTEDAPELESNLHQMFRYKRVAGEWFALSSKDLAYIESVKLIYEQKEVPRAANAQD